MSIELLGYVRYLVRITHVLSVIFWIGTTLYLGRMARHVVTTPTDPKTLGYVHAIHGGRVWRYSMLRLVPEGETLHWFRWESLVAWSSGLLLLILNYWWQQLWSRDALLAFGLMALGTLVYHVIWKLITPDSQYEAIGVIVSLAGLMGLTWLYETFIDPYRTIYHVAGTLATIMAIQNVWITIMPAQQKMLEQGGVVDPALAARAMRCTRHNTYMMPAVVMLMMVMHHPGEIHINHGAWSVGVVAVIGGMIGHLLRKKL